MTIPAIRVDLPDREQPDVTVASFKERGFVIVNPLFPTDDLAPCLDKLAIDGPGTRDLLEQSWCADLSRRIRKHPLIAPLFPPAAVAVQCTFFQKSTGENWLVPMHQDLSIPVRDRIEDTRLNGWSDKDGTLFVQPPDEVLVQLVAVRLHLDRCELADGPLRVVPGSHKSGRLTSRMQTRRAGGLVKSPARSKRAGPLFSNLSCYTHHRKHPAEAGAACCILYLVRDRCLVAWRGKPL